MESANDAIFIADVETGIIIDVNKRAEQMIGLPSEKIIGMHQTSLHPPEEAEHYKRIFEDHINSRRAISEDICVCNKDGRRIPVEISASITELKGRKIIQGIFRDITKRKKTEEALKDSKLRLNYALDASSDGIWDWNIVTGEVIFSKKWCESLGYDHEDVKEHISFWKNNLHPDDKEHTMKVLNDHFQGKTKIYEVENRLRMKSGEYRYNLDVGKVVEWDDEGNPVRMIGTDKDITKRKQIEQELKDSEERMKLALEGTDEGIWDWDMIGGRITFCNNWARILGYEPGEMEFNFDWWNKSIHPNSKSVFEKSINDYFKGRKKYYELEYRIKSKSGDWRWIWARGKCVAYNTQGLPCRMIGTHRDITEHKLAKELLQKQRKVLKQKNIALSEILGQLELEKKQIKDNIIANAENLLLPVIQKLRLKGESRKYVQLLRKNLQELTSSFGARLTEKENRLTSREIEICNMIKNGLTSKEIASLSNISRATTERHRANIRKKLGIINKDINLSSFLRTL